MYEEEIADRRRQLRVGRSWSGFEQVLLAAQTDRDRRDGREDERECERAGRLRPRDHEGGGRQDPNDPFAAQHGSVCTEAAVARERAPRDVRGVVRDDADEERDEQQRFVMEEAAGDRYDRGERRPDGRQREDSAEPRRALDEWPAADALRAPVREGTAHLLFEWLEEAGRDREDDDPETEDRAIVDRRSSGTELAGRKRQERVSGHPGDRDARPDRVRTFRHGQFAGEPDQAFLGCGHEPAMVPAVLRSNGRRSRCHGRSARPWR
jgi:hypothetical protein